MDRFERERRAVAEGRTHARDDVTLKATLMLETYQRLLAPKFEGTSPKRGAPSLTSWSKSTPPIVATNLCGNVESFGTQPAYQLVKP